MGRTVDSIAIPQVGPTLQEGDGQRVYRHAVSVVEYLRSATKVVHQALDVSARAVGPNRPTEIAVGTVFGWQVGKTKEFYASDRMDTTKTGLGPNGSDTIEVHLHLICNNVSASKEVSFTMTYEFMDNEGTVLGGAGSALTTQVTVPTTAYENFQVRYQVPVADVVDKPYLTARWTRNAISGNPDPDDDPIVYKVCMLYDAYVFGE